MGDVLTAATGRLTVGGYWQVLCSNGPCVYEWLLIGG